MKLIISVNDIKQVLPNNGKIFTVVFRKSDGSIRRLTGRKGVKKYLNGNGLRYKPEDKGMFTMFDMSIMDYRLIKIENIQSMKINKIEYTVS